MGTLINLRSFLALHVHVCRNNRAELCVSSPNLFLSEGCWGVNKPTVRSASNFRYVWSWIIFKDVENPNTLASISLYRDLHLKEVNIP